MNHLKYQSELLFESLVNESIVYYSPELRNKLLYISKQNVIAKELIEVEGEDIKSDITFINFGDEGYFTFIQMDKAIKMIKDTYPTAKNADLDKNFDPNASDVIYRSEEETTTPFKVTGIFRKSRNQIRIGKAVKKLLSGKYSDSEIEEFVNLFKATQAPPGDISIVLGDDITEWYKSKNHYSNVWSSLANSCMNDSEFLKIYTNNPEVCQMLILTIGDKLVARALVWKLHKSDIPGNPEYFMDRVYYINDKELAYMREFAKSKGWAYRTSHGYEDYHRVTYNNKNYSDMEMVIKVKKARYRKYPYADTFKRYIPESGMLFNDSDYQQPGIILAHVNGSHSRTYYQSNFIQRLGRFIMPSSTPLIESKFSK